MSLGALIHGSGGHVAAWRHPQARADGQLDFDFRARLAQTLENARFDVLFVADVLATWGEDAETLSRTGRASYFEPLTVLSALSSVTEHIGLVATATTTYNAPADLARRFASLDQLSGGRAGWNVVTSLVPLEAANFGFDEHLAHHLRYERADGFVTEVRRLWGQEGMPRSPQQRPVIFQAGSSEDGREFASRHGEVLFTAQTSIAGAQEYYADVKARAARHGRDRREVLVWPAMSPLVAATEAEARRRVEELEELVHDEVARRLVQDTLGGFDLSGCPLDGPLPEIPESDRSKSRRQQLVALAREGGLTIRQLARRMTGGGGIVAGTPEQIADHMESWFRQGAADGFNLSFPYFPGPVEDFADHVVPLLRRRGLLPADYAGTTLRENLGLPSPAAVPAVAGASR
ncbi:hypothetical protein M878_11270 [Streptomyces roseochromogenus subsp. oscitans DS 12.976]|uniref:Luciferase-like domain-containing protein n=2 Tax=Streptomyces roseochromogenus TaxID=285450 RepID=V6KZ12_STRRC|nr:hypothetical protein M878_11270 [Streptomyces roseochromogenus subsp. oscitans DS 12.976]